MVSSLGGVAFAIGFIHVLFKTMLAHKVFVNENYQFELSNVHILLYISFYFQSRYLLQTAKFADITQIPLATAV